MNSTGRRNDQARDSRWRSPQTRGSSYPPSPYFNNDVLAAITDMVCDRIDDFLSFLGVDLKEVGKQFIGPCPIHGSDRSSSAINLYPDGDEVRGVWFCHTNHCHEHFRKTFVGFVRGVLSHNEYGWSSKEDQMVPHKEAVNFICEFLGISIGDVKPDREMVARRAYSSDVAILTAGNATSSAITTRDRLHRMLEIPSTYYLERGYSREVLEEFDVGLCTESRSGMHGRVVVPIYDDDGYSVLGVTGRSLHERCEACRFHHSEDSACPSEFDRLADFAKWRHSTGLKTSHHLYGMWSARPFINESQSVVLVEGPGDVWRLREAGIMNSVGIFGATLSDYQRAILERCIIKNFFLLVDGDEAGERAAEDIRRKCESLGRVSRVKLDRKDVGEMLVEEVVRYIKPQIGEF